MTNAKSTKRALLTSMMAMLLCFTMLLGTTYAWFTDSASSGVNTIQAGNLDVTLEYATWNSATGTWTDYAEVSEEKSVFNENALWEPGYTEVVKFRVTNAGTLALKYQLGMDVYSETGSTNVYGDAFKLSDFILVGSASASNVTDRASAAQYATKNIHEATVLNVVPGPWGMEMSANVLYPENSPEGQASANNYCSEWVFVIHMPETVGNEANYKTGVAAPTITFGVNLVATQLTYEEDSFGSEYDKTAGYNCTVVITAEELAVALERGDNVMLTSGLSIDAYTPASGFSVIAQKQSNGDVLYGLGKNAATIEEIKAAVADGYAVNLTATTYEINEDITIDKMYLLSEKWNRNIFIKGTGTLTVNDAYVSMPGAELDTQGSVTLVLNGGNYNIGLVAIYNNSTLTINGGEFKTNNFGSVADYGFLDNATMNINGGKIVLDGKWNWDFNLWCSQLDGSIGNITLNVTGGEIDIVNGAFSSIKKSQNNANNTHINISGGVIKAGKGRSYLMMDGDTWTEAGDYAAGIANITGGTFVGTWSDTPGEYSYAKYIADGYKMQTNADGSVSIVAE